MDTQPATSNPTRPAAVRRCLAERPLREWPIGERPIERLATCGSAALSDTELIAALLSGNTGGTNPVALAQQLIVQFGGWQGLQRASLAELQCVPGMGRAPHVSKRHWRSVAGCCSHSPASDCKSNHPLTSPRS